MLEHPKSKIRVLPAEIGGGFGGKTTVYLEPLAAVLSRKIGRPVKMTMNRTEVLIGTGPAPGAFMTVKMGVTNEGKITAVNVDLAFEAGGYPGSAVSAGCLCCIGPFDIENFRVDGYDVIVNKPKSHAYRAPGAPQAEFAVDALIDEICAELDMDPLDFRRLNASKEGDLRVDGTRFHPIGNIETIDAAEATDHWQSDLGESTGTKRRGRGVASGYWLNGGGKSSAVARASTATARSPCSKAPWTSAAPAPPSPCSWPNSWAFPSKTSTRSSPTPTPSPSPASPAAAASPSPPAGRPSRPPRT